MLLAKFPQEGPALAEEFAAEAGPDRLRALVKAAGLASSLEDFRSRTAPPA